MKIAIAALIILGISLWMGQVDNAKSRELLAAEEDKNTYLTNQVSLYQEQTGRYEEQVAQLEDEVDFYKGEAEYWRDEAAFKVVDWQGDKLREWSSTEELRWWLDDNPISERKPIPNRYDCDDFAIDLVLSALADGYWIGLGVREGHMFNFTIIGNDILEIEAMTDAIELWGTLD